MDISECKAGFVLNGQRFSWFGGSAECRGSWWPGTGCFSYQHSLYFSTCGTRPLTTQSPGDPHWHVGICQQAATTTTTTTTTTSTTQVPIPAPAPAPLLVPAPGPVPVPAPAPVPAQGADVKPDYGAPSFPGYGSAYGAPSFPDYGSGSGSGGSG